MTKKQEKIKEAYGQYWDLVEDLIRPDGSLKESVWFGSEIDLPYHDLSTGYLRPDALHGISDNNGWISIESEADFPKNKLDHSFVYSLKENMISSIQSNIVQNDQIEELFEDDWITHYQPIVKPKPPIY